MPRVLTLWTFGETPGPKSHLLFDESVSTTPGVKGDEGVKGVLIC